MDEQLGPLQEVFEDLKKKWREMQDEEPFLDMIKGFIHAIDWKETWIRVLIAIQLVVFLLALFARKRAILQGVIFLAAAGIIFQAERLNALAAKHWERFSKQDYFDTRGVFFSALVSFPLIFVMLIVLINYLISCSAMLIQAKRKELIYKAKQRSKKDVKKEE